MTLVPLFDPKEFLDFAEKIFLCKKNNPHLFYQGALIRTGISRYYYACFLLIRREFQDLLKGHPDILEELKKPSAHGLIIKTLKNSGIRNCIDLGINLHRLRMLRNSADYEIELGIEEKDYHRAKKYAEFILNSLDCIRKIQNLEIIIKKFIKIN